MIDCHNAVYFFICVPSLIPVSGSAYCCSFPPHFLLSPSFPKLWHIVTYIASRDMHFDGINEEVFESVFNLRLGEMMIFVPHSFKLRSRYKVHPKILNLETKFPSDSSKL